MFTVERLGIHCRDQLTDIRRHLVYTPMALLLGRGAGTRTRGLHVPNVARYQLRYTPTLI